MSSLVDTGLRVDTLITNEESTFEMGSAEAPIKNGATARIIIDDYNCGFELADSESPDFDPFKLGQGFIGHGRVDIHGARKDSYATTGVALTGETSVVLHEMPENWQIGDEVVIAGTKLDGTGEEVRVLSGIDSDSKTITFDQALEEDHTTPPHTKEGLVLKIHIGNLTRNVVFETAEGHRLPTGTVTTTGRGTQSFTGDVFGGRGHTMFMHNQNVDVRFAAFNWLGRTNKLIPLHDAVVDENGVVTEAGLNPRARYPLHFHRAGMTGTPGHILGNVVAHDTGWSFVNHGSNAHMAQNFSYDSHGAGFVTERGDELGSFLGNLSIKSQGHSRHGTEGGLEDWGHKGHGFWFQGPHVYVRDNIASGASETAFELWFTRSKRFAIDGVEEVDRRNGAEPEFARAFTGAREDEPVMTLPMNLPLNEFIGNTAYGSPKAMFLDGFHPGRGGLLGVQEDFLGWNVAQGVSSGYASNMRWINPIFISDPSNPGRIAVNMANQIEGGHIEGFIIGIALRVMFTNGDTGRHIENVHLNNLIDMYYNRGAPRRMHSYIIRNVTYGQLSANALSSLLQHEHQNPIAPYLWEDNKKITLEITGRHHLLGTVSDHTSNPFPTSIAQPQRLTIELDGVFYRISLKREQAPDYIVWPTAYFRPGHSRSNWFPDEFLDMTNQELWDLSKTTLPDGVSGFNYINWMITNANKPGTPYPTADTVGPWKNDFPNWNWSIGGFILPADWQSNPDYVDGAEFGMPTLVLQKIADVTWDNMTPVMQKSQFVEYKPHWNTTDGRGMGSGNFSTEHLPQAVFPEVYANGASLRHGPVGNAQHGYIKRGNQGTFTYFPDVGFTGIEAITYSMIDRTGYENYATAYIRVGGDAVPWNQNPSVVDDYVELARGESILISVLDNDSDVDGDTIDIASVDGRPSFGSVKVVNNEIEYTADKDFVGWDRFNYFVADNKGMVSRRAKVLIRVDAGASAENNLPIATDDQFTLVVGSGALLNVLANDSDPDGGALIITSVQSVVNGSASIVADTVSFTPNASGPASFSYTISDLQGGTATARVSIDVEGPLNVGPVAVYDEYTLIEGVSASLDVLLNDSDADGGSLLISSILKVVNGVANVTGDGLSVTFMPTTVGPASFFYTISDQQGGTATALVRIVVEAPEDPEVGDNLIVNGNAENGLTGWSITSGIVQAVQASANYGFAASEGTFYFAGRGFGGPTSASTKLDTMSQSVDVSSWSADVNDARVTANLTAQMTTWTNRDKPILRLEAFDAAGQLLGSWETTTGTKKNWTSVSVNQVVPSGTTRLVVTTGAMHVAGGDNDGYADDISLTLVVVPGT